MRVWLRLLGIIGVASWAACSLVLNWSEAGLPCEDVIGKGLACLEGYSCLPPYCVPDGSISEGHTCYLDRQCATGFICPEPLYVCVAPCTPSTGYFSDIACGAGQYCQPFFKSSDGVTPIGACVAGVACNPDAACVAVDVRSGICVAISGTANACLQACNISFDANNLYSDDCPGLNQFCQPVGLGGHQRLVCLNSGTQPQQRNQLCLDPVSQPCQDGFGCINGFCRAYCQASDAACAADEMCCPYALSGHATFGYCLPSGQTCPVHS